MLLKHVCSHTDCMQIVIMKMLLEKSTKLTSIYTLSLQGTLIWGLWYIHARVLSHVQLFVTTWTVALQAPLSMGFSRQAYWNGLPFPTSEESSWLRDWTYISCVSCNAGGFLTTADIRMYIHGVMSWEQTRSKAGNATSHGESPGSFCRGCHLRWVIKHRASSRFKDMLGGENRAHPLTHPFIYLLFHPTGTTQWW